MIMKIPNSGSGNGFYGHDNGVISYLDNVEAEADVQAGGDGDFSEYMWMENEEEFDKQVNNWDSMKKGTLKIIFFYFYFVRKSLNIKDFGMSHF